MYKYYIPVGIGIIFKGTIDGMYSMGLLNNDSMPFNKFGILAMAIFCLIGIIGTANDKTLSKDEIKKRVIIELLIIILGYFITKVLTWIIIISIIVLFIAGPARCINFFNGLSSNISSVDNYQKEQEDLSEKIERLQRNIESVTDRKDFKINSDGTRFKFDGDDKWLKVSRDGSMFEDSEGKWHKWS